MEGFDLGPFEATSVVSGPHVPGSAHFDGRAIDIGGPVGLNRPTWDFIVRAVQSGRFKEIGTMKGLVDKLGPWAQQNGVTMFEDEGTGPHVHLQVDQ